MSTPRSARRDLLQKRRSLLRLRGSAMHEEQELLATSEPDWEDLAANRAAAATLHSLGENELAQLIRVDAALDRIERGSYGHCSSCGQPIETRRLRLVPEADRCSHCTNHH